MMFSFVGPLCLAVVAFPGQVNPDPASMVAPAAFHVVQVGTAYKDVKRLLGPATHGSWRFFCGYKSQIGWYSETGGEAHWNSTFGTVTVHYVNGKVTAKSFKPNGKGIEALGIIHRCRLLLGNALLRHPLPRFGLEPLRN